MNFLYQFFTTHLLSGTNCNDTVIGTPFSDHLHGYAGNDTLYGGWGNDTLNGGAGADVLNGGCGIDTATYENATSGVGIHMGNPAVNFGEAAGDTYISIENIKGSSFNDEIVTDGGDNTVWGGAGNDSIATGDGNDIAYGEAGDDLIYAGSGNDKVYGGSGDDGLWGDDGHDFLDGGTGNDYLTGGSGHDTFAFNACSGHDTIADFTVNGADSDVIQLKGFGCVDTFAELQSLMTECNGSTTINFANGAALTLNGVQACSLTANDFCFV